MTHVYDPKRVARLAQISTKFHSHAAVGDEVHLGIEGDDQMPASYRGARPTGTIVKIKNEGSESSTLRVQMKNGRTVDLHPFTVAGDRVWEFTDKSWEKVLARNQPEAPSTKDTEYRGSSKMDEVALMRKEMQNMSQRFDREMAETKHFNNALVESIAAITGEIEAVNPSAKFSKCFRQEYKGMKHSKEPSPFLSDMESDDDGM